MPAKVSHLFPDKLKDMQGYPYKIIVSHQFPRLNVHKGRMKGIDASIFTEIVKHQNASMKIAFEVSPNDPRGTLKFYDVLIGRMADLTLNTVLHSLESSMFLKFINTYDEVGFCALIPIPSRLSFLHFILTPFDAWSWILLTGSIAISGVMWKLLRRRSTGSNSAWYFIFNVVGYFLAQSIPMRQNRRMQVALLQTCILMTFIMGNVYQSLIIALMSKSRDGIRMKTVDEMFSSDLKFKVTPRLLKIFKDSGEFSSIHDRLEISNGFLEYKRLSREHYGILTRCDFIEDSMNVRDDMDLGNHYYILPEKIMPFYEKIILSDRSPFYEKLQTYHDFIFESGIRQYWKYLLRRKEQAKYNREETFIRNEGYYLTMDDLYGVFYILLVGFILSFTACFFENRCDGLLRNLNVKKSVKRVAKRNVMTRRRFIRVRPVNVKVASE